MPGPADAVVERTYPAAGGTDETAGWSWSGRPRTATSRGRGARGPSTLAGPPQLSPRSGRARRADPSDIATVRDWAAAFTTEVLPHDSPPSEGTLLARVASGRINLWEVDGMPSRWQPSR